MRDPLDEIDYAPLEESVEVSCPWCGERQELSIALDTWGEMVRDCEVCCRPWTMEVSHDEWGDPQVRVEPAF